MRGQKTRHQNQARVLSGAYYGLVFVAGAIGILSVCYYLYANIASLSASLTRVPAPAETEITLPVADNYIVFHEYRGEFNGDRYSVKPGVDDMDCSVESADTGENVALRKPAGSYSYTIMGRSGVSVYEFTADSPGPYRFSCFYKDGSDGPFTLFSIGQGFLGELANAILISLAMVSGTLVFSILLFVFVYEKRRRALKRRESYRGVKLDAPNNRLNRTSPSGVVTIFQSATLGPILCELIFGD